MRVVFITRLAAASLCAVCAWGSLSAATTPKVEFTDTLDSMQTFYRLHCQTRRGHGLPPQPARFFESIARHLLGSGKGILATAWSGEKAVASAVLLHHGRHAIYKFGASDEASRHLRPNNLLMWELIQWAALRGFTKLDLGRTSLGNAGLRRFKLGLGAREEKVEYFKYDFGKKTFVSDVDRSQTWVNHLFRRLPLPVLRLAGRMIYPHLA